MDCKEFLISRRSIRKFKKEAPPLEVIKEAINIARYAPSAKNRQPWEFIIVDDRRTLDELSEIHPFAKPLKEAPMAVVTLANMNEAPLTYLIDGSITSTQLWLALHCLKLGAVWIQTVRNVEDIRRILNIPQHMFPVSILAIGYPDEKPLEKYIKELSELVHYNVYGNKAL